MRHGWAIHVLPRLDPCDLAAVTAATKAFAVVGAEVLGARGDFWEGVVERVSEIEARRWRFVQEGPVGRDGQTNGGILAITLLDSPRPPQVGVLACSALRTASGRSDSVPLRHGAYKSINLVTNVESGDRFVDLETRAEIVDCRGENEEGDREEMDAGKARKTLVRHMTACDVRCLKTRTWALAYSDHAIFDHVDGAEDGVVEYMGDERAARLVGHPLARFYQAFVEDLPGTAASCTGYI